MGLWADNRTPLPWRRTRVPALPPGPAAGPQTGLELEARANSGGTGRVTRAVSRALKDARPAALRAHGAEALAPRCPPNTWHGWMALEDDTIVAASGSEVHNRQQPDAVRVSLEVFGDVWTVKGR